MGETRERESVHAAYLDALTLTVRAELWDALEIDGPMKRDEVWPWVADYWYRQRLEGERLTLRMPPFEPGVLPPSSDLRPPTRVVPTAYEDSGAPCGRVTFLAPFRGRWPVSVFAGVYLEDDLELWPREGRWGRWTGASPERIQPLALVALAATSVQEMTACTPEDAVMFLLCDEPFEAPGIRLEVGSGCHGCAGYGVHVWAPNWLVTVDELCRLYADERKRLGLGHRTKQPERHTGELIALVERTRPHGGKHPGNATWAQVLEDWNTTAPPKRRYLDERSIQTAYRNARKVRRRKGLLPSGDEDERQ